VPLGDQTDIQASVRPNRAGCLTGGPQILFALPKPAAPTLPGSTPLSNTPGVTFSPRRFARLFRRCTGIGIEWLPPILIWWIRQGPSLGIGCCLHLRFDRNRISWTLLSTDLTADTGGDLNRMEHHPWALSPYAGDRTLSLCFASSFSLARGTCHIKAADRAEI